MCQYAEVQVYGSPARLPIGVKKKIMNSRSIMMRYSMTKSGNKARSTTNKLSLAGGQRL